MNQPKMTATGRPKSTPSATIVLVRRGRYTDDDAVMVGTARGDAAGSHSAVYDALRKAKIDPNVLGAGSFKLTFDPGEIDAEDAVSVVEEALRAAGVKYQRLG